MAAPGLTRQITRSFGAGMHRAGAPELIPLTGVHQATNCLLDKHGAIFKRGGTSWRSAVMPGSSLITWVWDGTLAGGGQQTLVNNGVNLYRANGIGPAEGFTEIAGVGAVTGRPAVYKGIMYLPGGKTYNGTAVGTEAKGAEYYAIVANRLVAASNTTVWVSKIGEPGTYEANEYIEVPGGVKIIGLEPGRDSLLIFTTGGVWILSNLAVKLTDASGNPQWKLDRYSGDLVLWQDRGIAGWQGSVIVPGTDAIYLINRGVTSELPQGFQRISDPIRELYREYVKRGYFLGGACVYENHYLLPVLYNTALGIPSFYDVLVCRLDLSHPRDELGDPAAIGVWTHLRGAGAQVWAFAVRVPPGAGRSPELIGGGWSPNRLQTCNYFNPGPTSTTDADTSVPEWQLETRAYSTGQVDQNLVARLRVDYLMWAPEGVTPPQISAQSAHESPEPETAPAWGEVTWGTFSWSAPGVAWASLPGTAPTSRDGQIAKSWRLREKCRYIRFRLFCQTPTAQLQIKSIEVFTRQGGRP